MKNSLHIIFCLVLFATFHLQSQTANIDFELTPPGVYTASNAVSGWTISSQTNTNSCITSSVWTPGSSEFSIVSTPIQYSPAIGNILTSPLGGANVAKLNSSIANSSSTRLSRSFTVTNSSSALLCAFAGFWQNSGNHLCCDQTSFVLRLTVNQTSTFSCLTYSAIPSGSSCINGITSFSYSNGAMWTNWQVKYFDLSPFTGSLVTLEIITSDCTAGDHYGTLFVDTKVISAYFPPIISALPVCTLYFDPGPVNLCPGSSQAMITAPYGYFYQWIAPGNIPVSIPQGTMQTLITTNISPGSVYTVNLTNPYNGCTFANTYTIANSSVNISAMFGNSSCMQGTSGTASVIANGSSTGYNYTWLNSNNVTVGTGSSVVNLAPGNYSVLVTGAGASAGCGSSSASISIGTASVSVIPANKPYCGNEAYFNTPPGSTNYNWYNSTYSLISTNSSFTLNTPSSGAIYRLTYIAPGIGCRDSIEYTLVSVPPGSLSLLSSTICPGASNGSVTVFLSPPSGAPFGVNSYSVFSVGTTPAYNASVNPTGFNVFNAGGLHAGGTYSVSAFDGLCKYVKGFSVTPLIFNYTLNPTAVFTLCPGGSINASVTFTSSSLYNQYTYSWSPSTFLIGTTAPNAIVVPSIPSGSIAMLVYSVTVTPTLVNCPITKTISFTAANPSTPTINPIPPLCSKASQYSITANPSNGTFINGTNISIGPANGILTPSLALIGLNTFTYANSIGTCVARSSGSFVIKAAPSIVISGNTAICEGQSTTLLANGADTYTWSNSSISPFITLTPYLTNSYWVEGTNLNTHCSDSKTITVSVVPHPTITISGDTLLCLGQSATLTANGANSYNWNNGSSNQVQIISPNTTSVYSVIGTTSLASCSNTQSILIKVINCTQTGINEWTSNETLNIYPNPTNGKIIIETKNEIQISLYNQLGQILLEEKIQAGNYNIDLSTYKTGLYFLTVKAEQSTKIIKLVRID